MSGRSYKSDFFRTSGNASSTLKSMDNPGITEAVVTATATYQNTNCCQFSSARLWKYCRGPPSELICLLLVYCVFAVWKDHFKPSKCPHAVVYRSPFGGGTRQYILHVLTFVDPCGSYPKYSIFDYCFAKCWKHDFHCMTHTLTWHLEKFSIDNTILIVWQDGILNLSPSRLTAASCDLLFREVMNIL